VQYSRWYCDFCKKYAPRGVERALDSSPEKTLMSWYEDVWKRPHETSEADETRG
jgi:ribosomal protein L44E